MATMNGGVWNYVNGTGWKYKVNGTHVATVTGLASTTDMNYLTVSTDGVITVPRKVLGASDVKVTTITDNVDEGHYTLAFNSNELESYQQQDGSTWNVRGTSLDLLDGKSAGYELSDDTTINYSPAKAGEGGVLATLSGVRSGLTLNSVGLIDGITVSGNIITFTSKNALENTESVTVSSGYALVVADAAKPQSTGESKWQVTKSGTAELTTSMTAGYTSDGKTVTPVAAEEGVKLTLSGINKKATADEVNAAVKVEAGIITINEAVLPDSGSMTFTGTGSAKDYTLALDAANTGNGELSSAVWSKTAGKDDAALKQTVTKAGYYVAGKTIAKGKENDSVTLASLKGLASGIASEDGSIAGVTVSNGVIAVTDKKILAGKDVTLGTKDPYVLKFNFEPVALREHFSYDAKKGSATIVKGFTDSYALENDKKVKYSKAAPETLATISGLPKNAEESISYVEFDEDTQSEETGIIEGLEFKDLVYDADGNLTSGKIVVSQILLDDGTDVLIKASDGVEGRTGVKALSLAKTDKFTFELNTSGDEDKAVQQPTADEKGAEWDIGSKTSRGVTVGTGVITLGLNYSDGWKVADSKNGASKEVQYVAAETKTLATISNLSASLLSTEDDGEFYLETDDDDNYTGNIIAGYDDDENPIYAVEIAKAETEGSKDKIILHNNILNKKAVSWKNLDGYEVSLADDVSQKKDVAAEPYFTVSNGKASLYTGTKEAYTLNSKGTGFDYTAAKPGKALATVTITLNSTITDKTAKAEAYEAIQTALNEAAVVDTSKNTITLNGDFFDGEGNGVGSLIDKITLSSGYTFKFGTDVTESKETGEYSWGEILNSKGNHDGVASYVANMSEGYLLSDDGLTITNNSDGNGKELFQISGLAKTDGMITALNDTEAETPAIAVKDGVVKLNNSEVLANSGTVALNNGTTYKLDVTAVANTTPEGNQWELANVTKSGTTTVKATLYTGTTGGYEQDSKTGDTSAKYVAAKKTATYAEITGLKEGTTETYLSVNNDKSITVGENALNDASEIKLTNKDKNNKYTLVAGAAAPVESDDGGWVKETGATTASLEHDVSAGYTSDGTKITYSAETTKAIKVTGLKASATQEEFEDSFSYSNGLITIYNDDALTSTNVTKDKSVADTIKFKLETGVTRAAEEKTDWSTSKNTATLKTYNSAYYSLDKDDTVVKYNAAVDVKGKKYATVSGIASGVDINDVAVDNVITLNKTHLQDDKGVTLKFEKNVPDAYKDYKLSLYGLAEGETDEGKKVTIAEETSKWSDVKSTAASLQGSYTNGYTVAGDGLSIIYHKTTDKATTLATVKGLTAAISADDYNEETKTTTLHAAQIDLKKGVTVNSGTDGYAFSFAADYENASITGDKNDDVITVAGSGLFINTKKGNDYVGLGEAGGNVFFYASGDGDDVIANFGSTDTIQIKDGTKAKVEVAKKDSDAVVTITKGTAVGTITLKDYKDDLANINICNEKNVAVTPTSASSGSLFYSDNYGTSADLSGIVGNGSDAGLLGDLNMNKDYTSIAPQQTTFAYSGGKQ